MKISLEQLGRMQTRRAQPTRRRGMTSGGPRWLQPVLLVFGVLFVVTFIIDMAVLSHGGKTTPIICSVPDEIRQLERDITVGGRYSFTNGLFSIVRPSDWRVLTGADIAPYDVTFISPNTINISVSATPVAYNDLPALFAEMSRREREFGVHTDVQTFYLHGIPAARREVQMVKTKTLVIDFVSNRVAHQIFCEVPLEDFEQYRPTLLKFIETYQPGAPLAR